MKAGKAINRSVCMVGISALLLLSGLLAACRGDTHTESPFPSSSALQPAEATLSSQSLTLWLARSHPEKTRGLMFIDSMTDSQGMLFVYESPQIMSFWMKNTKIPLDLIFFSENLEINGWIKNMQPGYGLPDRSLPHYTSEIPAQYALELNAGSIDRLGLKTGDRLEIPLTLLYSD